jgi:MOSC domain-containing protein YiiM
VEAFLKKGQRLPKVISVNVGTLQFLGVAKGRRIMSGIHKHPVEGSVAVRKTNFEGDKQADLTVHGGVNKAVYVYPSENYPFWKTQFPGKKLPWGSFGENLTTEGLLEDSIRIGDRLVIGAAEFEVMQPRMPCYKLGLKFETQSILKTFLDSRRSGFYLRVLTEGTVRAGDQIKLVVGDEGNPTVKETVEANSD